MEAHSEAHDGAKEELFGGLTEVSNGNVSGRIEAFNGLAEGSTLSYKCGNNGELPSSKISELMKLGNLENASTNSLLSVVNRILEECIERNNNEGIPLGVGSVLKLVVQEIEQRVSKQADNMRKQKNVFKSREDRYQSRIRALETLTIETNAENEVAMNQLQKIKIEKTAMEEMQKLEEQDLLKLRNDKQNYENQISWLNEELVLAKKSYEDNLFQLEAKGKEAKDNLQKKIVELELLLSDSVKNIKDLEDFSESKYLQWKRKEQAFRNFINSQFQSLEDLKSTSELLKQEVVMIRTSHAEDFYQFGLNLSGLMDVAQNYHSVLEENRKLFNEVQDLKGNIRVYCRVRPFPSGQSQKQTTIQYMGENGELVVLNSSKPGKDGHRLFKFNKVFGPAATQEEVFRDTQPLIRSVLDGYNVCIFAYGQTGSGKTYTMTGPNMASVVDWGVNYRALNDLFTISQRRHGSFSYDVGVQMVEIYNEQVRDLLRNDNFQKRLGIWNTSQPNGLAVPDASLHPVKSTADVLELMNIGLMNRAVGATALNERSSRSHSILTVHVRGTDLETNGVLRGCLHLVDLAGSERVERSEATGNRLREAQHINKSLSALGDVIFALAQKSPHVPYRNSKLTQVLQSSLGGQAKTLMFVQLNPDVESYSETISTLKFAERVSGVELGAARSNKEGRGVRELMEQVASLKDALAKKDDEIGRLRLRKSHSNIEERGMMSPTYGSSSPRRHSLGGLQPNQRHSVGKSSSEKAASDNSSQYSDKHSEASSQQSIEDFKHHKEFFRQSRLAVMGSENFADDIGLKFDATGSGKYLNDDVVLLGFGDDDSERLSDISDGVLSMGTETDGSISSIVEYTLFPETTKPCDEITERPAEQVQPPKQPTKTAQSGTSCISRSRSSSKIPSSSSGSKVAVGSSSFSARKPPKRWQ